MNTDRISGGLAGKILRVNLSSKEISTEDTEKYARRFIGGRTINSFILLNEMAPGTKWSDPENILIFGVGCLVGTLAPGACRVSVDTKNVFTGGKGSANGGGHFGAELKYAGFDHVVITGKAQKPVYLWIHDGDVEIRDASSVWGKTTYETEEILQKELGDDGVKVASIGPAGENLVKGSTVIFDSCKVAGGSGVGCVMGDKKVKALAVRGHGSVNVAQPERFLSAVKVARAKIMASPSALPMRGAIISLWLPDNPAWDLATVIRNGQDEGWPMEKRERLAGKDTGVASYIKRVLACFSCPVGGIPFQEIEEGKYKGTQGSGYWLNSLGYSERFDVDDPAASLRWHLRANQLGLDGDVTSVVSSWAFECYQKGLLTKEDTDGLELEWGNEDAMVKLLDKIAYRDGFGDFLADGVKEASRKLGKGSEAFALHVKGQDTVEFFRTLRGYAFGVTTSPVGPRHLRGAVWTPDTSGLPGVDFSITGCEGVPEAVFGQGQFKEIEDAAGVCVFMGSFFGTHALVPSDYAELVSSAMGIDITAEELLLIGRRGYNLEKAFNTIHTDLGRKDDFPPPRFMEEPIKSGPYAGNKADEKDWNEMLDKFYELQGWDKRTGWQTGKGLTELGMEDVAGRLEKVGKLID